MTISKKNTRMIVTLPKDLKDKLKKKAELENRSVSNFILNILQKEIEGDGKCL